MQKFSTQAHKAWEKTPVFVKINTLNEAWCDCCNSEVPMTLLEGKISEGQNLLLEGSCEHCGGKVATGIIEEQRLANCCS